MAHYAFLDNNNIVTEVITGIDETELIEGLDTETWYGNFRNQKCIRTSYSGRIRKRFAGIGYFYDEVRDAFIEPKPYLSWVFNEETLTWDPPTPCPENLSKEEFYVWNEETISWDLFNPDNFK